MEEKLETCGNLILINSRRPTFGDDINQGADPEILKKGALYVGHHG